MKKSILLILIFILGTRWAAAQTDQTCKMPLFWQKWQCQAVEQAILDATVRIAFHGWLEIENGYEVLPVKGTISHATVVDGRYLLTHNHFGIPLSQVQLYNRHANGGFEGVSIYRLDGTVVLDQAPLDIFTVVEEARETVLLDFGMVDGQGFFDQAGLSSARAASADRIRPLPGQEVALVDWDGQGRTQVVWARINDVYEAHDLPLMKVEHFIEIGASGGGVFYDGRHIGNNLGRIIYPNGEMEGHESLIALNF